MALDTRVGCVGCSPEWRQDLQLTLLTLPRLWCLWIPLQVERVRHSYALEYLPQWFLLILHTLINKARARNHDIKILLHSRTNKNNKVQESRTDKFWTLSDQIDKRVQTRVRPQSIDSLLPVHGSCRHLGKRKGSCLCVYWGCCHGMSWITK